MDVITQPVFYCDFVRGISKFSEHQKIKELLKQIESENKREEILKEFNARGSSIKETNFKEASTKQSSTVNEMNHKATEERLQVSEL